MITALGRTLKVTGAKKDWPGEATKSLEAWPEAKPKVRLLGTKLSARKRLLMISLFWKLGKKAQALNTRLVGALMERVAPLVMGPMLGGASVGSEPSRV